MGAIAASSPGRQIRLLPLGTLSDERLAELAQAGHSDAFSTLYERYREALSRYCRSIVRDTDDAGDALQNTMVSVLRALQGRGPAGPVRPWLYRIAHNESISIIRRRHPHEELSAETPDRGDPEVASLARYRFDALLSDLRTLPDSQRGAIVMRELGGLDYAEIADALSMSAVSARKHVFEARVALHDIEAGRETDCTEILRRISDGDGRVLRARSVRGHLRGCPSCAAFERGMRTRPKTLGLLPVLPLVTTGTVLAAVLGVGGGGGASTSGLAAGGTVAGGSIAAGSMAAGTLLGGGSFAAFKGMAIAGALAVAGAGVIVGTGISQHARNLHRGAQVTAAAHSGRARHVTSATSSAASPQVPKPVHLAVAEPAPRTPALTSAHASVPATAPSTPHRYSSGTYTPPKPRPSLSATAPSKQAPVSSIPVAGTTPTASPAPTPTPAPTTAAPAAGTSTPATASTLWIDSIIESALAAARGNLATAEAQAEQRLSAAGVSPYSATIQGLISSIFSGYPG